MPPLACGCREPAPLTPVRALFIGGGGLPGPVLGCPRFAGMQTPGPALRLWDRIDQPMTGTQGPSRG